MTTDWMADALCVGVPELFHPESDDSREIQRLALGVCDACPVVEICREQYRDDPNGVVGGTTRMQRQKDSRLCGSVDGYMRHQRFMVPPCKPCREAWHATYGPGATAAGIENRDNVLRLDAKGYETDRIIAILGLSETVVNRITREARVAS